MIREMTGRISSPLMFFARKHDAAGELCKTVSQWVENHAEIGGLGSNFAINGQGSDQGKYMGKGRLEAFSDGVIASIITILVLELKRPEELSLAGLLHVGPHLAVYALSFLYVGIYWNNHHHLFNVARGVNGAILWANLHLLFWLSLVPFASSWLGENYLSPVPVALYGMMLLMSAIAYAILAQLLVRHEGETSVIAKALGKDRKTLWSIVGYAAAIALAPFAAPLSLALYAGAALSWFIPDRRIERALKAR
jgi:uncharacterized membrane protein